MEKCFNYSPSFTQVIFTVQEFFHIVVSLSSFSYFLKIISVDSEARLVLLRWIFNVFFIEIYFYRILVELVSSKAALLSVFFLMDDLIWEKKIRILTCIFQ